MNAEAWCYFLPSIMALSIRLAPRRLDVASGLIESLKADTSASQAFLIERYRLLSPEERATISEWLNRISRHEIYPGEQIVEAFQTLLWLNSLAAKWPVPKS
jgi:hypothetical protein